MMNQNQMNAAMTEMTQWLTHPQELGKAPSKIQCAGTFDLYGLRYYMFKYKKGLFGKWLLGVCGGYEGDELEHCGHIFSEMEEYQESTAVQKSTEMVEMIRAYWMEHGKQAANRESETGQFVGFVLLSDPSWNPEQLLRDLEEIWQISGVSTERQEDSTVFYIKDTMVAISLVSVPIPNGEAEQCAKQNNMWPQAVEAAKAHRAHLIVAVLDPNGSTVEAGQVYVKVAAACCRQNNVLGIYNSGVVFEPKFYASAADIMKKGRLPILNWIWFGLYHSEHGICGYTYGMEIFGKDEMEVLNVDAKPPEVQAFLMDIVSYVLGQDVTFLDGETLGFSAGDRHTITRSMGVSLPQQMTLKISY